MSFNSLTGLLTVVLLLVGGKYVHSQEYSFPTENNKETLQVFDRIIGRQNTSVFNGVEYIEKQRMINEKHKFLNSFDFQKGTVYYQGQAYYHIPLKYNVPENLLLVRLKSSRGDNIFQLYNEKLEGFVLGSQRFINFSQSDGLSLRGIYEILEETPDEMLLKKHQMKERKILEGKLLYYEFEADNPQYFYLFNNQVAQMDREVLQELFPDGKQEIRRFYRTNSKRLKNEPDFFMKGLFEVLKQWQK